MLIAAAAQIVISALDGIGLHPNAAELIAMGRADMVGVLVQVPLGEPASPN